jgi:outer membrane receptor protein involved in Fe transport
MGNRITILCLSIPVAALLLLGSGGATRARADQRADELERTQTDLMSMSVEELLDIQIVAASKTPQALSQAPASTSVITRDEIQRFGYRTLGEALRRVIGFYHSSDRLYDYLGIRGYARPGDYNTRMLLLVDGHRYNEPIYDYAPIGEDFDLDVEAVERIEIVKGPGSALWGSNALLAVINVVTRKGADVEGGRAGLEYGSHHRVKGFLELGQQFDNGLEIAGMFSGMRSDSTIPPATMASPPTSITRRPFAGFSPRPSRASSCSSTGGGARRRTRLPRGGRSSTTLTPSFLTRGF